MGWWPTGTPSALFVHWNKAGDMARAEIWLRAVACLRFKHSRSWKLLSAVETEWWRSSFSHQGHQWLKKQHLVWYRLGVNGLWVEHKMPAASLKMPHLWRYISRVSWQLDRVPGVQGTPTHPAEGQEPQIEDRHVLVALTMEGPWGAAGPWESTLSRATMEEWQWPTHCLVTPDIGRRP